MLEPFIVGFGATCASGTDFKVVIETDNVLSMPSVVTAQNYCFSTYYVSFPPEVRFVILRKVCIWTKTFPELPMCETVLINSLERVPTKNDTTCGVTVVYPSHLPLLLEHHYLVSSI